MPQHEVTHSTKKNDKKEVTHYEIAINTVHVGNATKTDKGKFNFKPINGAGKDLADIKTMKELKVEVLRNTPKAYLEAHKPAPKEAKPAKPKKGEKAPDPVDSVVDPHDKSEDIALD